MKAAIMCQTCNSVMGAVYKDAFNNLDADLYLASMRCVNGHLNAGVFYSDGSKVNPSPAPGVQPAQPTGPSNNIIANLLKFLFGG